jgi:mycofactocin precursor
MENDINTTTNNENLDVVGPEVIEEIVIEELSIDGVCGVY